MNIFKSVTKTLAAVMLAAMLAGCGGASNAPDAAPGASGTGASGAEPKDAVTVNAAFLSVYNMADAQLVQDAMNKILEEKYGIKIQLTFISAGSWREQTNMLLTGSEADLMTYFMLPLSTFVSNGQCLPLDKYVAAAGDKFKSLFSPEQLSGCQIGGVQYAIPNLRNYGNDVIVNFDEAKLEQLGYKPEDVKTMEDVEKILYEAHKAFPDIYTLVPQASSTFSQAWTWDGLGDQNNVAVIGNRGQDTTVTDIFENKDFIELCRRTHKWYEDGLMMGDALSNQETGTNMIQNGAAFAAFANSSNAAPPAGVTKSVIFSNWTDSTNISALTFGINSLSKHPDETWTLLEALYTDTELMTLLIDGIEGAHYVLNSDGTASYPEGVTASTSAYGNATVYWAMPYAKGVPPIVDLGGPAFFDELIAFNNASLLSKGTGFVLDTDAMGITDEYTACINVKDKYYNGLMCGVLDPETTLPAAHREMVDAGIEKICAAKQKALDELLGRI
ncbi:MAG: ABC transporter substrate-binding protein [Clostridiales bacterium]|jgi:putative aldouronate transport system substrate-binding protein|nr:ABC transporter substrate-binding protein [Clostridiales bacterium]